MRRLLCSLVGCRPRLPRQAGGLLLAGFEGLIGAAQLCLQVFDALLCLGGRARERGGIGGSSAVLVLQGLLVCTQLLELRQLGRTRRGRCGRLPVPVATGLAKRFKLLFQSPLLTLERHHFGKVGP